MSFTSRKYVRFRNGEAGSRVLFEGLHVVSPKEEVGVARIVETVSAELKSHALLTTNSREHVDLNCPPETDIAHEAHQEYRETIQSQLMAAGLLLNEPKAISSPFVTFSIHGMRYLHGMDIAVGTNHGKSVSPEVRKWLLTEINKWGAKFCSDVGKERLVVGEEGQFCGWNSLRYHRDGDGRAYRGYGKNFNHFQLEFSLTMRVKYHNQVIELLKVLGAEYEHEFK